MNIGTKANAIDDLGKLNGNKMTIKVDGKQIYPQKRYVIVRVDNNCPEYTEEDFECPFSNDKVECEICRQGRYGDTKEQLIRKVVQVMLRRFKRMYKGKFITVEMAEKQYLEVAKEIVEFLGVK